MGGVELATATGGRERETRPQGALALEGKWRAKEDVS